MSAFDNSANGVPTLAERSYQGIRDAARSDYYQNDVAQRHHFRSRLSQSYPIHSDRESDVTSALTLPDGSAPLASSWPQSAPGADPLPGQLDRWLAARGAELVAIRRHIHANPELSGQEFETAALLARELAVAGLNPQLLPKGNGVICDIGHGDDVIALRADIDALPLPDTKDVPYRSTVPNVCHACGHDVHATIMLGVGLALAHLNERGDLPGRVRLLFQPSEEKFPSGAPEVINAGGLKDVRAIFALHCAPQIPTGLIGVRSGPITAAADVMSVRLAGRGGHTARPHLTTDLVYALGKVITDVPAMLDRRIDTRAGVSLTWGAAHAGQAPNAIPISGEVSGTVRALSRDAWRELPDLVPQVVRDVVAGTGAEVEVTYTRGVPPVINDRACAAITAGAAGAVLGGDRIVEAEISMGGEDFAYYLEHVPGAMIRLGTGIAGAAPMDIHQSSFDIDERSIGYGVRVMVHTALAAISTGAF
ncbi:amidohydrolase [Actinomycetes bacterium KLBMP 9797]